MLLQLIADSHGQHRKVITEKCDVLIHAGDISGNGELNVVYDFINWFANQPATWKIFCAGNHERSFEDPIRMNKIRQALIQHPSIIYLQDEEVIIDGVKFYGSPWTPAFCGWAFNSTRQELQEIWSKVPLDTDVLISHGPPYGYGDQLEGSFERVGDKELLARIYEVNPKLVICGHIHCGAGCYSLSDKTTVLNVALVDEQYYLVRDPVMINYKDFI